MIAVLLAAISCAHLHKVDTGARLDAPPTATFEMVFSPSRQSEEAIIHFIGEARRSVHVAAYAFTSKEIAQALLDARMRGLDVRVVVGKGQKASRYSVATFLAEHTVSVRIDDKYQLQHQNVVIVDGVSLETGSYNFMDGVRDRNSENVLIIRNVPELAAQFEANWEKMWSESVILKGGE